MPLRATVRVNEPEFGLTVGHKGLHRPSLQNIWQVRVWIMYFKNKVHQSKCACCNSMLLVHQRSMPPQLLQRVESNTLVQCNNTAVTLVSSSSQRLDSRSRPRLLAAGGVVLLEPICADLHGILERRKLIIRPELAQARVRDGLLVLPVRLCGIELELVPLPKTQRTNPACRERERRHKVRGA
jgi:hypothetical protein